MTATLITLLYGYLGVASGYAVLQLVRGMDPTLSWFGLALAAGSALVGLIADQRASMKPRRPNLIWTVLCGLGMAITLSQSYRYGPAAGWAHGWAGAVLVGWFAYVRWLRKAPTAP